MLSRQNTGPVLLERKHSRVVEGQGLWAPLSEERRGEGEGRARRCEWRGRPRRASLWA